jgi:hypothetical protein
VCSNPAGRARILPVDIQAVGALHASRFFECDHCGTVAGAPTDTLLRAKSIAAVGPLYNSEIRAFVLERWDPNRARARPNSLGVFAAGSRGLAAVMGGGAMTVVVIQDFMLAQPTDAHTQAQIARPGGHRRRARHAAGRPFCADVWTRSVTP